MGHPLKESVAIFSIAQSIRQPLEDFELGATLDGVSSRIIQKKSGEEYEYRLVIQELRKSPERTRQRGPVSKNGAEANGNFTFQKLHPREIEG